MGDSPSRRTGPGGPPPSRWLCHCQDPPLLLATYDTSGRINIKVRDRYWHVLGSVQAICPRCGAEHLLDLSAPRPSHDGAPPTSAAGGGRRRAG